MKSRSILVVAAATALILVASGCSASGGSQEGSVKLEFQTGLSVDSTFMKTLTSITKKFQTENPGITIELVPSSTNYESDMKVRLAAGNPPDIWNTHGWSLLRYSEFLTPLQAEPWAKNFNPALATAMKNKDGEFFAFPVETDVAGIIYNKDVLKAAGIDPQKITSWDDFTRAAEAVKSNGVTPITVSGKDNGPAGNLADWISPGTYTADQLAQQKAGTFVSGPYKDMLEVVGSWKADSLFNPDFSSATTDDMSRALAQGKTAFIFAQNYIVTNALQYNPKAALGYMPIPSLLGGDQYLLGGELDAYGISNKTKNPKAAKEYIAFLAQPTNGTKLAEASGSIPGLTDAKADLGVLQDSYDQFVAPAKVPLIPYFDRVYLPNGMWNTMVTTTSSVVLGGQSAVSGAVEQMSKDFSSLYGQGG